MLASMPPTPTQPTERNLLEAFLWGWSTLCLWIAGTVALVLGLLLLCGAPLSGTDLVPALALVAAAAVLRVYAKLARR
jgi:hypothetical protein